MSKRYSEEIDLDHSNYKDILTSKEQIELYERLEAFIEEWEYLCKKLGGQRRIQSMVNLLMPFMIRNMKVKINGYIFMKCTRNCANN